MSRNNVWGLIPAAGIGARMGAECPKQYLPLLGKPILLHTLEKLCSFDGIKGVLLGLAKNDPYWPEHESACNSLSSYLGHYVGGKERADTVLNGILALEPHIESDNDWVLVHDAARPCIRHQDIQALLTAIEDHEAGGLLGLPIADTVKRTDNDDAVTDTVDRSGLWRALTPQVFRFGVLKKALKTALEKNITVTDESSAVESAGYKPLMVAGTPDNIKITLPGDLKMAELYLSGQGSNS